MPQKPLSYCTTPTCKRKVASGKCSACRGRSERQRGSASKRGYGPDWEKIRARYLQLHPICEHGSCIEEATDVHHKDGRGPRGDNSDANLESLCHKHHSEITAKEHRLWSTA